VPYDDARAIFPSENPIATITRTLRGGTLFPSNAVVARPNPRVLGWGPASATDATHIAGGGTGSVQIQVVNSSQVKDGHDLRVTFTAPSPDSIHARTYALVDRTTDSTLFAAGTDFDSLGIGPVGAGLLPWVRSLVGVEVDSARSGFTPSSPTNIRIKTTYQAVLEPNLRRFGYPENIAVVFDDVVRDTSLGTASSPARPAKFRVFAHTASGDRQLDFKFRDVNPRDSTLSDVNDLIDVVTPVPGIQSADSLATWRFQIDTRGQVLPIRKPRLGDVYELRLKLPLTESDVFAFTTRGERVDPAAAKAQFKQEPYVVPNPYIEAASFEPAPFGISGRGDRRIEFRGVTQGCTIRIYTVRGDLVQTLRQDGSPDGFVAWNLRTKDNLDVAPGLYIYHVDAPGFGTHVGKFAILK
jgi:hypothetical protein